SHSMGGLIVRAYLSGKQVTPGLFNPRADPKIGKWISIATPNFGALFGGPLAQFAPDDQVREILPDSQFLFDLATWNQNHDDLRGVDAIGIIGNAGGLGSLFGLSSTSGNTDGLVPVTSASLRFAVADERTRVLPYCHSDDTLVTLLGGGCNAPPLAKIQADDQLSYLIINSFLAGTDDWKRIGHSPSQDPVLSKVGGTLQQKRDSADVPVGPIQNNNFVTGTVPGTYTVVIDKPGPKVYLVAPAAARLSVLSVAPRMIVSIYGDQLDGATASINGQTLTQFYTSTHQINALLPADISGLVKLTVANATGKFTENLFVEDAVPAVFSLDGSGTGTAAVIRTGNFISLYVTGLGTGAQVPTVLVNGTSATVSVAGPAPGFPGLDQINFAIPAGLPTSGPVPVTVQSGKHLSNTTTLML
ncbi:MAG: hypothetical protein M3Y27_03485, partial [Acidobacteriota bacterium]|nr:hypothetical protein [Acidobacteriota bacterium]